MRKVGAGSERWQTLRLGDVLLRHNEIIHPGDRKDGEATFVGLEHVEPNTGRRVGSLTIGLGRLTGRKPTFRRGQIVYGYLRPYLNKVWIAEFDGCSSVDQFAFSVRQDVADTRFIAAFMRSETFLRRSAIVTTTGQLPRISTDQIAAVRIDLPRISEQRRIAKELDQSLAVADSARRAAEERLAAAEALPVAYLREAFESRSWIVTELRELCRAITDGTHLPPPFTDSGLPFLFVRNIVTGTINFDVQKYISEETYDELTKKHKAEPGDVLFSAVGSFGVAAVVRTDTKFAFQRHIAHIKPDTTLLDADFLAYFLNSPDGRFQSEGVAMGGAQRTVTLADLRKFRIPVPPLAEQHRISGDLSRRLQGAEAVIARCREELQTIKAFPASLLRAAFNGEP